MWEAGVRECPNQSVGCEFHCGYDGYAQKPRKAKARMHISSRHLVGDFVSSRERRGSPRRHLYGLWVPRKAKVAATDARAGQVWVARNCWTARGRAKTEELRLLKKRRSKRREKREVD
jgi:hypothetical protein